MAGIDGDGVDLLGRVVRDGLDVHAAFGRDDERDAAGAAIDQQSEVEFLVDVDAVGHVEAVDLLAGRAGLDGDERVAEHVGRCCADFVERLGEADAALGVGAEFLELALAAAAGVDLRLHDIERPGQLLGGLDGFLDRERGEAGGDGGAELREQFLGLIFVDVHGAPSSQPKGFSAALAPIRSQMVGKVAKSDTERAAQGGGCGDAHDLGIVERADLVHELIVAGATRVEAADLAQRIELHQLADAEVARHGLGHAGRHAPSDRPAEMRPLRSFSSAPPQPARRSAAASAGRARRDRLIMPPL